MAKEGRGAQRAAILQTFTVPCRYFPQRTHKASFLRQQCLGILGTWKGSRDSCRSVLRASSTIPERSSHVFSLARASEAEETEERFEVFLIVMRLGPDSLSALSAGAQGKNSPAF